MDKKVLLSTVWLFAILNYLYCDYIGLLDPSILTEILSGSVSGMVISAGFLLGASILMEIPIAMVLLSRVLKYKVNRWFNIIAGSIMTLVQIGSLFMGAPTLYYTFFSIIEIAATVFIVVTAWKWIEK